MKRGVVVEYDDDFVTLLTPDGQFLKTKNKKGNYQLGEELSSLPIMDEREEAATRLNRAKKKSFTEYFNRRITKVAAVSILAIMFFMFSFLPFMNNSDVYAYMSIDINPSFEVGINDQLNVMTLDPLNEEAEMLIQVLPEWKNKPFETVVSAIVEESKDEGYIYPGKEIIITTVVNEEDPTVQVELEENIDDLQSAFTGDEMLVNTLESDQETREKALQQGISTGKYIKLKEKTISDEEKEATKIQEETEESSSTGQVIPQVEPKSSNNNSQLQSEIKEKTAETLDQSKRNSQNASYKEEKREKEQEKQQRKIDKQHEKNEKKFEKEKEKREKEQEKQQRKIDKQHEKKFEKEKEKREKALEKAREKREKALEKAKEKQEKAREIHEKINHKGNHRDKDDN